MGWSGNVFGVLLGFAVARAGLSRRVRVRLARCGGGFFAGAAQTAMGVAGGVLLAKAIAGMIGGNEAEAAETGANDAAADAGDGGDFGDFEM